MVHLLVAGGVPEIMTVDKKKKVVTRVFFGRVGNRTPDILNANQALCQLSYTPERLGFLQSLALSLDSLILLYTTIVTTGSG